jgi:hypothetical protein
VVCGLIGLDERRCLHWCKRQCDGKSRGNYGAERRRGWTEDQKRAIVGQSLALGAVVSDMASRGEICPGQIIAGGRKHQTRLQRVGLPGADRAGCADGTARRRWPSVLLRAGDRGRVRRVASLLIPPSRRRSWRQRRDAGHCGDDPDPRPSAPPKSNRLIAPARMTAKASMPWLCSAIGICGGAAVAGVSRSPKRSVPISTTSPTKRRGAGVQRREPADKFGRRVPDRSHEGIGDGNLARRRNRADIAISSFLI